MISVSASGLFHNAQWLGRVGSGQIKMGQVTGHKFSNLVSYLLHSPASWVRKVVKAASCKFPTKEINSAPKFHKMQTFQPQPQIFHFRIKISWQKEYIPTPLPCIPHKSLLHSGSQMRHLHRRDMEVPWASCWDSSTAVPWPRRQCCRGSHCQIQDYQLCCNRCS